MQAEAPGIRPPQVSKLLRVLSEPGVVRAEPRARRRIYHLGDHLQTNEDEERRP